MTLPVATTRKQFQRKLLALSEQNHELQVKLDSTEQQCSNLKETTRLQELQIREMEKVIHQIPSHDDSAATTPKDFLLVEKTREVAELTMKLERLSVALKDRTDSNDHVSSQGSSEQVLQVVSKSQQSCIESDSISCPREKELQDKLNAYRQKCESLERSMTTLKQKNAVREIRSAKNLRLMRQQLDAMEQEKARRLELQVVMEERLSRLLLQNREKEERIAHVEHLLANETLKGTFGSNEQYSNTKELGISAATSWKDDEGWIPPILVAASQDGDTASETESQTELE